MQIIGLGHYSRTGKDTLADMIVNQASNGFKVKKISLAWKLKQICFELYAWAGLREPKFYDTKEGEPHRDITLRAIGMTPVELWIAFGTPAIRDQVYDRTWIDYVLQTDHDCDLLVVPDIRFPNEVEAFLHEGAILGKTVRKGYGPRDTKPDKALMSYEGWDFWAGPTIADLHVKAEELYNWASGKSHLIRQSDREIAYLKSLEKV